MRRFHQTTNTHTNDRFIVISDDKKIKNLSLFTEIISFAFSDFLVGPSFSTSFVKLQKTFDVEEGKLP